MPEPQITLHTPAPQNRIDELHARLAESGQALHDDEFRTFLFSVIDAGDELTAGCKGEIAFRSAHVSEIWVDEQHRGKGLGSALLGKAETFAAEQGCTRVHLETRSEAARELYEKLGYAVFGSLPDYDRDTPFYYLEKRLT